MAQVWDNDLGTWVEREEDNHYPAEHVDHYLGESWDGEVEMADVGGVGTSHFAEEWERFYRQSGRQILRVALACWATWGFVLLGAMAVVGIFVRNETVTLSFYAFMFLVVPLIVAVVLSVVAGIIAFLIWLWNWAVDG